MKINGLNLRAVPFWAVCFSWSGPFSAASHGGALAEPDAVYHQPVAARFSECGPPARFISSDGTFVECGGASFRIQDGRLERAAVPDGAGPAGLEGNPVDPEDGRPARATLEGPDGSVWLGTERGIVRLDDSGNVVERARGERKGLPWDDVLSLARDFEGRLLVGTTRGLARQKAGQGWEWYSGRRYLPGDRVEGIHAEGRNVWVATDQGLGVVMFQDWTLARKADWMESINRERHDRDGLVSGAVLGNPEDFGSFRNHVDDNDGLWTAMYVAAEAHRYAAAGGSEAKAAARKSLEALMKLERVTGIPGFPARSFAPAGWTEGIEPSRWNPTPDGRTIWKDDTSSDEIVGHYYGYSVYYDFAADEKEKEEIRAAVSRITDHIIDHGYALIDLDGKPTFWGRWSPEFFKTDVDGHAVKRINSLEILSHLLTAFHITRNPRYFNEYLRLAEEEGYADNMIYQRYTLPGFVNHSADELAFLSYYPLLRYAALYDPDPARREKYFKSLRHTYEAERPERNPLWIYIVCAVAEGEAPCDRKVAADTLRDMPIDLRNWRMENSRRKDIRVSRFRDRFGDLQATEIIPHPESCACKWNYNPYETESGNDGSYEEAATPFLLPYWMGRSHGFIGEG